MDRAAVMMLVTVVLSSCLVRSEKTTETRPVTSTLTPLAFSTSARSSSIPTEEARGAGGRTVTLRTRLGQEAEQWPVREMIAILGDARNFGKMDRAIRNTYELADLAASGGVLGFWGGVGLMGTIFLLVLVTQRCCSRRSVMEKKEVTTDNITCLSRGNILYYPGLVINVPPRNLSQRPL